MNTIKGKLLKIPMLFNLWNFLEFLFDKSQSFLKKGSKVECNLCGNSFKEFKKHGLDSNAIAKHNIIGAGIRKSKCYNCGSVDRDRLLFEFLKKFDLNNLKVLHVAPEISVFEKLKHFPNYYVGDLDIERYKKFENIIRTDITNLYQFSKNTFDLIICNHVLEHIIEDVKAIKELHRVVKKNGSVILNVPIMEKNYKTLYDPAIVSQKDRHENYCQFDHVRLYGQDFFDFIEKFGFKSLKFLPDSLLIEKLGLNAKESIFHFLKTN